MIMIKHRIQAEANVQAQEKIKTIHDNLIGQNYLIFNVVIHNMRRHKF